MGEKSVLTEQISARQARKVARALKEAGYKSATVAKCRGKVIDVATYFEPDNPNARRIVIDRITRATGMRPYMELACNTIAEILNM